MCADFSGLYREPLAEMAWTLAKEAKGKQGTQSKL